MRRNFTILFSLAILVLAFSGCLKSTSQAQYDAAVPQGTFSGQFRKIHISKSTNKRDTVSANLLLTISSSTGFKVTGDTTTLHAGSYGGYAFTTSYALFSDATYPTSGTPTKIHLNGTYLYTYDGSALQMLMIPSDTVSYQYDLKKQ